MYSSWALARVEANATLKMADVTRSGVDLITEDGKQIYFAAGPIWLSVSDTENRISLVSPDFNTHYERLLTDNVRDLQLVREYLYRGRPVSEINEDCEIERIAKDGSVYFVQGKQRLRILSELFAWGYHLSLYAPKGNSLVATIEGEGPGGIKELRRDTVGSCQEGR